MNVFFMSRVPGPMAAIHATREWRVLVVVYKPCLRDIRNSIGTEGKSQKIFRSNSKVSKPNGWNSNG
jgi:hypothetical protein